MADRAAKDALYEGFAEVARALASWRRAEIADLLAQGERPVEQIAAEIGQSVANTKSINERAGCIEECLTLNIAWLDHCLTWVSTRTVGQGGD